MDPVNMGASKNGPGKNGPGKKGPSDYLDSR